MNSKRFALVLAVVLVISMSASVVAANPFADVPAHHWAYDSIVQLQAVGLVEGYPDGTYGGANTLTRYEAAMVFARALANLEALVEDQVANSSADVKEELLSELDAVSVELSELIVTEFAKLGVIDDTVESNAAYVNMVTGRINDRLGRLTQRVDALDAEVNNNAVGQEFVLTPEAEAAIAELVANHVKAELAVATELAKETIVDTGVIERIVVDEVDEAVVEAIVKEVVDADFARVNTALDGIDAKVADLAASFAKINIEFGAELDLLGVRVDELEVLYADVDNRVAILEADVVALQADIEEAKAGVKLSGSLDFDAVTRRVVEVVNEDTEVETSATGLFNNNYSNTSNLGLDSKLVASFNARIDEGTEVSLTLKSEGDTLDTIELGSYLLDVVSDGTINRLALGDVEGLVKTRFDQNVTVFEPNNGAVADLDLAGFEVSALASKGVLALSADYQIWPALGFNLTGATTVNNNLRPEDQTAVAAGLYGDVFGISYDAKVAFDRYAEEVEENMLIDVNADASFGILNVGANFATAGANFGNGALTKTDFYDNDSLNKLGLDADANLFGVKLAAGTYFENGKDANNADVRTVEATMLSAGYGLDFLLPLELSGAYGWKLNDDDAEAKDVHTKLKVGITDLELFGLKLGTSYTFVNNYLNGNWRDPSKWVGQDAHIVAADLGYEFDRLDLGYDFEFSIPRNDTADLFGNQMSHVVTADYGFADGVSLNVAAKQVNFATLANSVETDHVVQEVKAGLGLSF